MLVYNSQGQCEITFSYMVGNEMHLLMGRLLVKPTTSSLRIKLCSWILPPILCSNVRTPVAQFVRVYVSDWHSEDPGRLDLNLLSPW